MPVSSNVAAARGFPGHGGRVCVGLSVAGGDPCERGMIVPWAGTELGKALRQMPPRAGVGAVAYRYSLGCPETCHKFWVYLGKMAIIKINQKQGKPI